jgi:hypothetical protein
MVITLFIYFEMGLFLVLAYWLNFLVLVFWNFFFHYCKFVCFVHDKNLGVFLILCFMFVNILF